MTEDKVKECFTFQNCGPEQNEKFEAIRNKARELVEVMFNNCPACADRTAAIRKVREAVMTANASIALKGLV